MDYRSSSASFLASASASEALLPDVRAAYASLLHTFSVVLDEFTLQAPVRLVGPFAKMDYLLKERGAGRGLTRSVNATRDRLRRHHELTDDFLRRHLRDDIAAVRRFIAFLDGAPDGDAGRDAPDVPPEAPEGHTAVLRLLVEDWDETYIYGRAATDPTETLRVSYLATGSNFDWTYVKDLLWRGVQLNLVRPEREGDHLRAELIIVEPDYLVNISTVAACFTEYADTPLLALVHLLQPRQTTAPILLGNLASQMLDEALRHTSRPYAETVRTFFHDNAVQLLTVSLPDDFHRQARLQRENIRRVVDETLPHSIDGYREELVMVEPSFFSEMLGLQGRMDFLQTDGRLLIEQKAGKGAWPASTADTPAQQETHYVQMLLYMALLRYNYAAQYEALGRRMQAFLLYSKYPNSLLGLGYAPELVHRAFRLRNQIVWLMNRLTQGGSTLLDTLRPERFLQKSVAPKFWAQYVRPQLEAVLRPIQDASGLERAYFHRMMTFVAKEQMLARLGHKTKENSGFAAAWHCALSEKLLAGSILAGLRLHPDMSAQGDRLHIDRVRLTTGAPGDGDAPTTEGSNFRQGDVVALYAYDEGREPDLRQTMVLRGTVERLTPHGIDILLNNPQTNPAVVLRHKDRPWAVEPDFMDSAATGLFRSLHAFLTADKSRRDLLLGQREPTWDAGRTLKGDYGAFNGLALAVKQARDFFLIIGPPGTGKTSFGLMTTVREELLETGSHILLLSYTNRAVDEICSKLVKAGLDFLRLGRSLRCDPAYAPYLLENRIEGAQRLDEVRAAVERARIVVATTSTMASSASLFDVKSFSLAVIDEASQILEPALVGLLSSRSVGKFVMIGDHKQLPAVVAQSAQETAVDDPLLRAIGLEDCRQSLFERLLRGQGRNEHTVYMLCRQGRMHPDIAAFPNAAFYEGRLTEAGLPHQSTHRGDTPRVRFLHVAAPRTSPSEKVNLSEADVIAREAERILHDEAERFEADKTLGIIVPYRAQITAVRAAIARRGLKELDDITIDTVERFQGSERRYIIFGFTVQHLFQLRFLTSNVFLEDGHPIDRRLNVALTRAQEHLIIVGNRDLLRADPVFAALWQTDTQRADR